MKYQLIWPSPGLRRYIQFYGLLEVKGDALEVVEGLIPPYPSKGLIFSLEENPSARIYNKSFDVKATEGYFMPQCTSSWHMQITGQLKMLGVFFRPGMFRHFFDFPARELTNKVLEFENTKVRGLAELRQQLLGADALGRKIQKVEYFLKTQLARSRFRHTLTDHALFFLQRKGAGCSVDALKEELGVSSRYFRKVFYQDIGIPPKAFLRIHRFNMAFQTLRAGRYRKLSDIAYQLDYYDQSHFIREFKYFTGATPLQFMKQDRPLHNKIYWQDGEELGG